MQTASALIALSVLRFFRENMLPHITYPAAAPALPVFLKTLFKRRSKQNLNVTHTASNSNYFWLHLLNINAVCHPTKYYRKIQQQIKDLVPRLEGFVEHSIQPTSEESEALQRQLHEPGKPLWFYRHVKQKQGTFTKLQSACRGGEAEVKPKALPTTEPPKADWAGFWTLQQEQLLQSPLSLKKNLKKPL